VHRAGQRAGSSAPVLVGSGSLRGFLDAGDGRAVVVTMEGPREGCEGTGHVIKSEMEEVSTDVEERVGIKYADSTMNSAGGGIRFEGIRHYLHDSRFLLWSDRGMVLLRYQASSRTCNLVASTHSCALKSATPPEINTLEPISLSATAFVVVFFTMLAVPAMLTWCGAS
jgi:hypothetical protein